MLLSPHARKRAQQRMDQPIIRFRRTHIPTDEIVDVLVAVDSTLNTIEITVRSDDGSAQRSPFPPSKDCPNVSALNLLKTLHKHSKSVESLKIESQQNPEPSFLREAFQIPELSGSVLIPSMLPSQ